MVWKPLATRPPKIERAAASAVEMEWLGSCMAANSMIDARSS